MRRQLEAQPLKARTSRTVGARPVSRRAALATRIGNEAVGRVLQATCESTLDAAVAQAIETRRTAASPARTAPVQRCGPVPPGQCACHDDETATSTPLQRSAGQRVQRECTDAGWNFEYDGCSLPARIAFRSGGFQLGGATKDNPAGADDTRFAHYKSTREGGDVCDRHDECYQSCGKVQARCDERMYADMKRVCKKSGADPATKKRCRVYAHTYFLGLKTFGGSAYKGRQEEVCNCRARSRAELDPQVHLALTGVDANLLADWITRRARLDYDLAGPDEEAERRRFYQFVQDHRDSLPDSRVVVEDLLRKMVIARKERRTYVTVNLGRGHAYIWREPRSCEGLDQLLQQLVDHATRQIPRKERTVGRVNFRFGSDARCQSLTLPTIH